MSMSKRDSFRSSGRIMQDTIAAYADLEEERLQTLDEEDTMEPTIEQAQEKYNQLQERYVTLKTMTESLKEKISLEKDQWIKELKATVDIQAEMRNKNRHVCGERCATNPEEYKRKMELFRDFIFFQNATENMENLVRRKNYDRWISEVENKCHLELLKIEESMLILKPLQDIAARWKKEDRDDGGASGDRPDDEAEAVPVKEMNEFGNYEN